MNSFGLSLFDVEMFLVFAAQQSYFESDVMLRSMALLCLSFECGLESHIDGTQKTSNAAN